MAAPRPEPHCGAGNRRLRFRPLARESYASHSLGTTAGNSPNSPPEQPLNLDNQKRQQLNELFAVNRRVMKAYLLKESLERLWTYRYEGAMLRYLQSWIDQLRWQRLKPFQNLALMLLDHLDGILNTAAPKYRLESWKPSTATSKPFFEGAGYKNLNYLLLKAQRMAITKTEFIVLRRAALSACFYKFLRRAEKTLGAIRTSTSPGAVPHEFAGLLSEVPPGSASPLYDQPLLHAPPVAGVKAFTGSVDHKLIDSFLWEFHNELTL